MQIKFEEKTYENYFNIELDRRSEIFFPPGQVQEGFLGFDSSAYSKNHKLWHLLGFPFWFSPHFQGSFLRDIADEMEHYLNIVIDNIPTMKANILFQYKRPEYITSSLGSEWSHWHQSYFRYEIYQHQQDLLNHIDIKLGNKVFIVYASPAINDLNDLVNKKQKDKIIEYSNFKRSRDLGGHQKNTYIESGTYSIAFSEPERTTNLNLIEELERLRNDDSTRDKNNRQFILNFQKQISAIMIQDLYYGESFRQLNESILKESNFELTNSFRIMNIFNQLTGNQWLIKI